MVDEARPQMEKIRERSPKMYQCETPRKESLGVKDVEVIDYGTCFGEIASGHRDDGHEATRMCNVCALSRLHIMSCGNHGFTAISNFSSRMVGDQAAFNSLSKRKNLRGRQEQINAWRSFCINPAVFRCATIQVIDMFANDIESSSPEAQGCGLVLCQGCRTLMDEHGSDIDWIIAAISNSMEKRADADFLVHKAI
ncbi:C6 finger domain protein, putative [Talaromyces stipitatus ATCC 10500]|uniref:C6 finger domain protein, putative n=1 Tax=Talaromyces stipitatus (strain ATCC 10500 / CBS 375.48 / QM 6759 / NRRL 1006) TaxID=441959 RepID=B8MIW7_TALSN|nr:C6 finger domain protein, putative [Talaromyces stipitatus ATCC 10500]EED15629.1 C6 finger domain protein, putative [Talaromyces stipitatus ATCC 10500]